MQLCLWAAGPGQERRCLNLRSLLPHDVSASDLFDPSFGAARDDDFQKWIERDGGVELSINIIFHMGLGDLSRPKLSHCSTKRYWTINCKEFLPGN